MWIYDERRPQAVAFCLFENPQFGGELLGGDERIGQLLEVWMRSPPHHVRILIIGAATYYAGIAVAKSLELLVELGQFRRANKREILRIKKINHPFACVVGIRKQLHIVLPCADTGLTSELRKRVAYGEHGKILRKGVRMSAECTDARGRVQHGC